MVEQVHWYARTPKPPAVVLEGRIEADVVVVGGGMAGLAAAEWLRDHAGQEVVRVWVLEGFWRLRIRTHPTFRFTAT